MNSKLFVAAVVLFGLGMGPAAAAVSDTTIDALPYSGDYPNPPGSGTSTDYVDLWDSLASEYPTPPAGYFFQTIPVWNDVSNSTAGGVDENLAYHDSVTFTVTGATEGTWSFRIGVDFGYGGALLVDGQALQTQDHDMWWAGSYSNPSQYLAGSIFLSPGTHTLDVYGAENCCDGAIQGQYLEPGATNYSTFAAPEPATWATLLTGFAGLGVLAYRRRTVSAA